MPEIRPIKSQFYKVYPLHPCSQCQLEHVRFPLLQKDGTLLIPCEILGVVEGPAEPGKGTPWGAVAHVMVLHWGVPGENQSHFSDAVYLN